MRIFVGVKTTDENFEEVLDRFISLGFGDIFKLKRRGNDVSTLNFLSIEIYDDDDNNKYKINNYNIYQLYDTDLTNPGFKIFEVDLNYFDNEIDTEPIITSYKLGLL